MKVLALDTSNLVLSVAVADGDRLLGEYTTNMKKNHSIRLMPAVSMLLDELGIEPGGLDGICTAQGPGSYTGVRIGVTTAKTMAWSLQIPLIGISSLEVLAGNASLYQGLVSPLFDARRGQVYTALFQGDGRIKEDALLQLDDWLEELSRQEQPVLFLGDDTAMHRQAVIDRLGSRAVFATPDWNAPKASVLARIGLKAFEEGRRSELNGFVPQYLQLAEAEAKWLASQKGSC